MVQGIPLGPYRLVRRLATGGMAEIFLARQDGKDGFSRELVVKRILPHLAADPDFRRMFQGEARLAARLSHPNVVHVYDYGSVTESTGDETFYLAMELVRGVDLRALILRAAEGAVARGLPYAVPPHHAAKICSFVCESLAYAHDLVVDGKRANIVHRDVTPSNVLLSFDGAVKLADFGIAKSVATGDGETEHGVVKGKYSYLSPEQARGEALDGRSDLFNVGILLFEAILGQPLFPQQDGKLGKRMSARGEIPDRLRLRRLPGTLADVAERALQPRREDRFPDALAMRAELEAFVRRSPEPSDTVELGRFVRTLFPETMAEDRRAVRAAGTIAKSDVAPAVRARTALLDDPNVQSVETALGEGTTDPNPTLLSSGTVALEPEPADATLPPTAGTATLGPPVALAPARSPLAPSPLGPPPRAAVSLETTPIVRRPSRARLWIAGAAIVLLAVLGGSYVIGAGSEGPPAIPTLPPSVPPRPTPSSTTPALPMGQLRIATDPPGGTVELDGEGIGIAPIARNVTAGVEHLVRAVDEGGAEIASERVVVPASGTHELVLSLRRATATLRIATMPAGASVRVDGALLGETPLALDVAPTPHHVEVSLVGYEAVADDVTFSSPGEQAMLSFALRRERTHAGEPHRPTTPPRGTGTLRIATDPYSEVYEGSRHLGTTPLQIALPAGHHTLSLRSPGHASRSADVEIRADEVTRLRLSL